MPPSQTGGTPPPGSTEPAPVQRPRRPARRVAVLCNRTGRRPPRATPRGRSARQSTPATGFAPRPYLWGGGHRKFKSKGYDCSGAVSYVLHAAGLLRRPLVSGPLASRWGVPGTGAWITVYANRSHTYIVVAGLRYDTSAVGESFSQGSGPRWRSTQGASTGYAARYYPGL